MPILREIVLFEGSDGLRVIVFDAEKGGTCQL
jgi:hypothetical protein